MNQKSPHQFYAEYTKEHLYQVCLNWSSSVRGEEFCIIVNVDDDRRRRQTTRTPSDGNSNSKIVSFKINAECSRIIIHVCPFSLTAYHEV